MPLLVLLPGLFISSYESKKTSKTALITLLTNLLFMPGISDVYFIPGNIHAVPGVFGSVISRRLSVKQVHSQVQNNFLQPHYSMSA